MATIRHQSVHSLSTVVIGLVECEVLLLQEAICQLADGMDDDSKTSTPSLTARHSTSPAPSRPPGCVSSGSAGGPVSGVPQLSPLETARLKMTVSEPFDFFGLCSVTGSEILHFRIGH